VSRGPVVTVEGARELRRSLARAGGDLGDMKEVHGEIANYVAVRAKSAAPRRSGRLASSTRGNRAQSTAVVRAGGASVPYAGVIHWGWARHSIEPQPFLVNTAHKTEPQWRLMYLRGVDKVLGRVKGM
jgi:hypothetical protein